MESAHEELRALLVNRSVKKGDFVLASGRRSHYYVDCRRTTIHAPGATLVGQVCAERVRSLPPIDSLGGLTLGADPIALATAMALSPGGPQPFTVRKAEKAHGSGRRIEGSFEAGHRVLVIEDTITSGGSALQAVEAIEAAGGTVAGVLTLVDRDEGGREAIEAKGYSVHAIFTIDELT